MERTLFVPVGIIVTRTTIHGPWAGRSWRPVGIFVGSSPLLPGSVMHGEGDRACFFAGMATLSLHATEIESYRLNLDQSVPCSYVVLKPYGGQDDECPPSVHVVTAAPDEAEAYLEGDEWLVGSVPMPRSLRDLLAAFFAAHEREELPAGRVPTKTDRQVPRWEGQGR